MCITDGDSKAWGAEGAHPRCGRACVQTQVAAPLLEPVVLEEVVTCTDLERA